MSYVRTALLAGFAATATLAEAQYLNPDLQQVNDAFMIVLRTNAAGTTPDKSGHFTMSAANDEGDQFMAKFADDGDQKFSPRDSLVYLRVDAKEADTTGTIPSYVADRNARNGFDITRSTLKVGAQHRDAANTMTIVPGSKRAMGNAPDVSSMTTMMVGLFTGRLPLRLE